MSILLQLVGVLPHAVALVAPLKELGQETGENRHSPQIKRISTVQELLLPGAHSDCTSGSSVFQNTGNLLKNPRYLSIIL